MVRAGDLSPDSWFLQPEPGERVLECLEEEVKLCESGLQDCLPRSRDRQPEQGDWTTRCIYSDFQCHLDQPLNCSVPHLMGG